MVGMLALDGGIEFEMPAGEVRRARREDLLTERSRPGFFVGDLESRSHQLSHSSQLITQTSQQQGMRGFFSGKPQLNSPSAISTTELLNELGGVEGANIFLSHLFFQWPTLPREPEKLKRYGDDSKTWPLSQSAAKGCIAAGGRYNVQLADSILRRMVDLSSCELTRDGRVTWPDFQYLLRHELGTAAVSVPMVDKKVTLTYKIPEEQIKSMLCGEYRMYCKSDYDHSEFSYGIIIDSVTEVESGPNNFGSIMRRYEFTGRPRLEGKYVLENGSAVWNEHGTGRLFLEYSEHWPDGMLDKLKARLKCNGKFTCDSAKGFIQKARKEDTLPISIMQRMESPYYACDQGSQRPT